MYGNSSHSYSGHSPKLNTKRNFFNRALSIILSLNKITGHFLYATLQKIPPLFEKTNFDFFNTNPLSDSYITLAKIPSNYTQPLNFQQDILSENYTQLQSIQRFYTQNLDFISLSSFKSYKTITILPAYAHTPIYSPSSLTTATSYSYTTLQQIPQFYSVFSFIDLESSPYLTLQIISLLYTTISSQTISSQSSPFQSLSQLPINYISTIPIETISPDLCQIYLTL